MVNPLRGEVAITINGEAHIMRLTLGALLALEESLGEESLTALVARFEAGEVKTRDILALILAALRGGGWQGTAEDLVEAEIDGGIGAAAMAAAQVLHRGFGQV